MRICVWSDTSFESSYASYHLMRDIILAMIHEGHEVWLVQVQLSDGAIPKELEVQDNLHIVNIKQQTVKKNNFIKRYINNILYFFESSKKIEKINNIDAIFLQSTNVAFFPVRFACRKKIPIIFNVQDIFPLDAATTGILKKWNPIFLINRMMQSYAYKHSNKVITISEDLRRTLKQEGCNKTEIIHNWSYQNEFFVISDSNNHFLKKYKIKREDGFRVVYAGNIGKMIDIDMIIKVATLLKSIKDIKFYIIGSGSNLNNLKESISREKLKNIICYPSQPMEYAADNYCMADVNINPIHKGVIYTCTPSKINTCLLSRKPTVISMDLDSDMANKLASVDNWKIVAPNDAESMAAAIRYYYMSSNWRCGDSMYSNNSHVFLKSIGPVENAYKYAHIIGDIYK